MNLQITTDGAAVARVATGLGVGASTCRNREEQDGAPPALLLASVALFLGYYRYARSIAQIHSYRELGYGYVPVLMGLYHLMIFGDVNEVWLSHRFWPAIWSAIAALTGLCLLWWVRHRERPDRCDPA